MPPSPVCSVFREDVAGNCLYERRVLNHKQLVSNRLEVQVTLEGVGWFTRSKAATFVLFKGGSVDLSTVWGLYFPTSRVLLSIRQLMGSGSFLDVGAKKFATAFSGINFQQDDQKLFGLMIMYLSW